jgi:hypothetical protein
VLIAPVARRIPLANSKVIIGSSWSCDFAR